MKLTTVFITMLITLSARGSNQILYKSLKEKFEVLNEKSESTNLDIEKLKGQKFSCMLVSAQGPKHTMGTFSLNFFEFFGLVRANLSFDSGTSTEGFISRQDHRVQISLDLAPNIELKKSSEVFFQPLDDQLLLEWTINEDEFLKKILLNGKLSMSAAWSALEASYSKSGRFTLYYGLCR